MATGTLKARSIALLWENQSPTTNFAGQTVSLPSNSCDAFMVVYNYASNRDPIVGDVVFAVGEKSLIQIPVTTNMDVGNFFGMMCRATSASTQTSITFNDAHLVPSSGNSSTNNLYLTPVRIYGISY